MKIVLRILAGLLLLLGSIYFYQFPYKKYVVEQKLYTLLAEEHVEEEDIQIDKVMKDLKTAGDGYTLYFMVEDYPYPFEYEYFFKREEWIKYYNINRTRILIEKIAEAENY